MPRLDDRKFGWHEMQIALNRQAKRPPYGQQFGKPKVAKLFFQANHPAEEEIVAIEFSTVPRPTAIGREELADHQRIVFILLRIEGWKAFAQLLR